MHEDDRFDYNILDEEDPFEVDRQSAHLFKHGGLGLVDISRDLEERSILLSRNASS